jgi:hypothetical protein
LNELLERILERQLNPSATGLLKGVPAATRKYALTTDIVLGKYTIFELALDKNSTRESAAIKLAVCEACTDENALVEKCQIPRATFETATKKRRVNGLPFRFDPDERTEAKYAPRPHG